MSATIPRVIVLMQEIALIALYIVAAGHAYRRRRRTSDPILRKMFLGVILLSVGVILQAIGINVAIIFFWEGSPASNLILWQASITGFFFGGHLLVRYDFRSLDDVVQNPPPPENRRIGDKAKR